jgi:hypothetical protein
VSTTGTSQRDAAIEAEHEDLKRQIAELQRQLDLQNAKLEWRATKSFPKFAAKLFGYTSIVIAVFSGVVGFILDVARDSPILTAICFFLYLSCWSVGIIVIVIADSKDWRNWNHRPMRCYLWAVDKCSIETPEAAHTWYDNKQCNYALLWGILVSPMVIITYAILLGGLAPEVKELFDIDRSDRYVRVMIGWIATAVTIPLAALGFGTWYRRKLLRSGRIAEGR